MKDIKGEPFVGKAGKLMDKAFEGVGIKREEVYIANIVKCRPPNNRNPEYEEADSCKEYLDSQIKLVNPEIIVLLGSVALKNVLGKEHGITASRGKWFEKDEIKYIPTFHPAALLRDETKKIDFWKDLKEVKRPEIYTEDSVKKLQRQFFARREMIDRIPDEKMPMDFHIYEISSGRARLEMEIDYRWDVFGISYSGSKKEMKQFKRIARDLYLYYGVSEEDIKNKTDRYHSLLATLSA